MDRLEPDFPYYSLLTIPIILLNISQNTPSVKHALPGWEFAKMKSFHQRILNVNLIYNE